MDKTVGQMDKVVEINMKANEIVIHMRDWQRVQVGEPCPNLITASKGILSQPDNSQ